MPSATPARQNGFRYATDPICLGAVAAYWVNRLWWKPAHPSGFAHDYLNDVLLIPVFLPPVLWLHRRCGLRQHDGAPTIGEVATHVAIWSACFLVVFPRLRWLYRHSTADPWNTVAYAAGGAASWAAWGGTTRWFLAERETLAPTTALLANVTAEPQRAVRLRAAFAPGLAAVRRHWRPFVLLQMAALILVVAYFRSPTVAAACDRASRWKDRGGLLFTAAATAVAGALLPEVAKAAFHGDRRWTRQRVRDLGFLVAAFAVSGVITDLQYRGMAVVFGHDTHVGTVLKKMLADQFVTTPLYGTTYWLVVYAVRADRYRFWRTVPKLTPAWYGRTVVPLLVTGWAFWIPIVLLIYSLPGPLQFGLFLFAVAAWSLLMVAVAGDANRAEGGPVV